MKVLVLGPSAEKSRGGMSTVIGEMRMDIKLCDDFNMDFYESYIDGNIFTVLCFSLYSYLRFLFTRRVKKYDIFHIHAASYGSTFRKMLYISNIKKNNKAVVFHIHGAEYLKFFDSLSKRNQTKIINMLKSVDVVVALSEEWKKRFESRFGITNCIAVENGINTDKLKDAMSSIEDHHHTMVSLGRLGKRKGTYDIINAVFKAKKQVADLKVLLAGDGEIEEVQKIIHKKGLENNIEVLGWIDYNGKIDALKQSAVLLLPSYNEGLPMAILEGMACGKGIISTTVGAIPEVVHKENGILIEPGDVEGLKNAIVELCHDNEKLKSMKQNNISKIYNKYSVNIMHDKIRKIYLGLSK